MMMRVFYATMKLNIIKELMLFLAKASALKQFSIRYHHLAALVNFVTSHAVAFIIAAFWNSLNSPVEIINFVKLSIIVG